MKNNKLIKGITLASLLAFQLPAQACDEDDKKGNIFSDKAISYEHRIAKSNSRGNQGRK
jgi:hypothetical protein